MGNFRSGRRPKLNAEKQLGGNTRNIRPDEAPLVIGAPEKPERITRHPVASAEWDRIVASLLAKRVLTQGHGPILTQYCEAYALDERIADEIAAPEFKPLILEPVFDQEGNQHWKVKPNPLVAMKLKCSAAVMRMAVEFGETPASHAKVKAAPAPKDVDPFEEFDGPKVVDIGTGRKTG